MPDDDEIRRVAAQYIRMRGPHAVDWLIEQAEIADRLGDREAGKTWRDIAAAADAILLLQSN